MNKFLEYWPVIVVILQGGVLWFCWSMRQFAAASANAADERSKARDQALDDRIDREGDRITALVGRMTAAEHTLEGLPTKADLEVVSGNVKVVAAKLDGVAGGIQRLEGYQLEIAHRVRA